MMKKHHEQEIRKIKSQISSLENHAAQLESCLHSLETSPETYFKILNPHNKKYTEFRKQSAESNKSNNDEEDMLPNEAEDKRGATASTGGAGNLVFFSNMFGIFHSAATSVPTWGSHSSSSYGNTAPRYQSYSSYRHTSGGIVSFSTLGGIFSCAQQHSQNQNQFSQLYCSDNEMFLGGDTHKIAIILTQPAILTLQIIP